MEMSYFNPFYPFAYPMLDPFSYCMPHYPFQAIPADSDIHTPSLENPIKIEETAPKK
jgi:hypothetical protein